MEMQKVRINLKRNKEKVTGADITCPLILEVNMLKYKGLIPFGFGAYAPVKALYECKGCRKFRGFNEDIAFINCCFQSGDVQKDIDDAIKREAAQHNKIPYSMP